MSPLRPDHRPRPRRRPRLRSRGRSRRLAAAAAGLALVTGLSACANIGRPAVPEPPPGYIAQLVLPAEATGAVQGLVNFNPYAPNYLTQTWLYEPLMIRNTFSCDYTPWLATDFTWRDDKTLEFTTRTGVQWSDGQPFSARDVAFTLNAAKKYAGMDSSGLWSDTYGAKATGVEALDDDTVRITFDRSGASKLDGIIQQKILPEHVYGSVGDVTKYIDERPVGTGPFTFGSYNGRQLILTRNTSYWQADQITVQQLSLEGQYDANSAALKLRNGALDVYTGDIPNPERSVARNSNTKFYYAPAGTTVISPNNQKFPTDDVAFREAMAYAIDKDQLARKASFGVMAPASQSMLLLPVQADQLPEKYRDTQGYIPYDPAKAAQLLDEAGYRVGPDGWRTGPDGQPMELTFSVQAGYIDYLAMTDVIVRNLRAVGIDIRQIVTDPAAVDAQKKTGDFQMTLEYVNGGCARARDLGGKLQSSQIPTEDDLLINMERYSDPQTDELIEKFQAETDPEKQQQYTDQLIGIYLEKFPLIALQYAPSRLIYNTEVATGWPSADNPYPVDSMLVTMTKLRPAESR